jgi:hypothetical protein
MTFDDLPDETTWRYLEAQGILPVFNGGKSVPGGVEPACERESLNALLLLPEILTDFSTND